jgi:hypothetical protein
MIFGDSSELIQETAVDLVPATVAGMLTACSKEAARLAEAISRLDQLLSTILPPGGQIPLAVQEIDLLRQEAEGLASVLRLVAFDPTPERILNPVEVSGTIAVWAQCQRLHCSAHWTCPGQVASTN